MAKAKKAVKQEKQRKLSPGEERVAEGRALIRKNEFFRSIASFTGMEKERDLGKGIAYKVYSSGEIYVNPKEELTPKQWAHVMIHCRLHLCFGHFDADKMPGYEAEGADGTRQKHAACDLRIWNLACDAYITRFLKNIQFGETVMEYPFLQKIRESADEREIYDYLMENGAGEGTEAPMDMAGLEHPLTYREEDGEMNQYAAEFAFYLRMYASAAVREAGGHSSRYISRVEHIAEWFLNCYPLLGAIASAFQIEDDAGICIRKEIQVAAVDAEEGIIYMNPAANLKREEMKFVLAHEYLHVGLQHQKRCQGREPYIWNVACDFVINGWLVELKIGEMPEGCLYDGKLKDLSAEAVYDLLVTDLRDAAKLATFRGYGMGDMLGSGSGKKKDGFAGISLDEFCRNALVQGLEYHQKTGRGLLPAGLVQEIRALAMPPIPWDVTLGQWFERMFPFLERRRSYARPSRRQSATPDIPRPGFAEMEERRNQHTFGVVVDTSGSMSVKMIGMALGAIASYAASREVGYARVVFCDAAAYDAGYMTPEEIAGRIEVKGRGGTVLQPGIDLLEKAKDFPEAAPLLIITDADIEPDLKVRRTHAFLIPQGKELPFHVRKNGEVFRFSEKSV